MRSRGRRRWWILVLLVGLYAAFGYVALPPLVKPKLEERLSRELGRRVDIGEVRIDPFAFSLALDRVQLADLDAAEPFAGCRRISVNFDPLQSIRGEWVLGQVALIDFRGTLEFDEQGTSNVSDLLERLGREPGEAPPRRRAWWSDFLSRPWRISRLAVAGARVDLIDRSHPEVFRTLLGPVDFTLVEFRSAGGQGSPYRFEARTESGEVVYWSGSITARPFSSAGEWRIENLLLSKYAPYLDERANVLFTSGKLSATGGYDVSLAPEKRRIVVTDGKAQISNLAVLERATGQPWLDVAGAEITGFSADFSARSISLGTVQLNGGRIAVRRDASGAFNLRALGSRASHAASGNQSQEPSAGTARPMEVTSSEIAMRDFTVQWQDATVPKPVEIELTGVTATLKEFSLAPGAAAPLDVTFGVKPQGTGRLHGTVGFHPWRTKVELELAWLPLPPFSAYLERMAPVRMIRGGMSVRGEVELSFEGGAPRVTFHGGGRLEDVAFVGFMHDEPLAGFSNLALNELSFTNSPRLGILLEAASLSGPYAHVTVDRDGTLNLAMLRRGDATPVVGGLRVGTPASMSPLEMEIARLAIEGGAVVFEDRSLDPQVRVTVSQIGGVLQGVTTVDALRGKLELRGFVDGGDSIILQGLFNPLVPEPFADLAFRADGVDLRLLEPYVARYAGHALEQGEMSVEGHAKLVEHQLDWRSTVTLHQLALGPANASRDAIKLPVALSVALLKDERGNVVLDLPIQGHLQDPEFRLGPALVEKVTNTLARVSTSPFAMLAAEFGAAGQDLRYQRFQLGDTTPTPDSLERLAILRRALAERPALQLTLEGSYDAGEHYELKRRELDLEIRQRVWDWLRTENANLPPVEELLVSSGSRANAILELFYEKFAGVRAPWRRELETAGERSNAVMATAASEPGGAAAAEPAQAPGATPVHEQPKPDSGVRAAAEPPPQPEAEETREEQRPGLVRRAWNLATLKGLRDRLRGDDEDETRESATNVDRPAESPTPNVVESAPVTERPPEKPAPAVPLPNAVNDAATTSGAGAPEPSLAGVPTNVSIGEMEQRLIDAMEIGREELVRLAEARAQRVKQILTEDRRIAPERVQIVKIDPNAEPQGARVLLELR